jgi:5-methyltetrahydrofolate--homocysteine methyltransferase
MPLLIGGATTSRQAHGGEDRAGHPVVHVLDASRAVNTVAALLDPVQREALDAENRAEQETLRQRHARGPIRPLTSYADANRARPTLDHGDRARPPFLGREVVTPDLARVSEYIDWTFFFTAWELKGRFPQILEHPKYGEAARDLWAQAQKLLSQILEDERLQPKGVRGFWPARSEGNDIVLFTDEAMTEELARFPMLRQQRQQKGDAAHLCLADYVAPDGVDHVGAFAVTCGHGVAEWVAELEAEHDDFSAIMVRALADRLAEAFAEMLHEDTRREWGHPDGHKLTVEELIAEKYRGIRPAFGYPACPDHTLKPDLFRILAAEEAGMGLTESFAMTPAASVSGLYLAHPESRYFSIGKVGRDQVADYAARMGKSVAEVEKSLSTVLGYEPAEAAAEAAE